MNSPFIQKAKQTPQQIAKKVAQVARDEIVESSKTAAAQITGQEKVASQPTSREAPQQSVNTVSAQDHKEIQSDESRRLTYLEEELARIRQLKKLQKDRQDTQDLNPEPSEPKLRQLVVPPSPPKKGMVGVRRKQQKMEIGKTGTG